MKMNLNRNELLRYVVNRVIKEDSNEETSHILWDWSCSNKLVSWFCGCMDKPFHIWIRKNGLECGYIEEVKEPCEVLGAPYIKMEITYEHGDVYTIEIE